jgi:hypothetical protein
MVTFKQWPVSWLVVYCAPPSRFPSGVMARKPTYSRGGGCCIGASFGLPLQHSRFIPLRFRRLGNRCPLSDARNRAECQMKPEKSAANAHNCTPNGSFQDSLDLDQYALVSIRYQITAQ